MRQGRFCWRSVPYARFCAWSFLVASDEVSRMPGHPPARHDTGRDAGREGCAWRINRDRSLFLAGTVALVVPSGRVEGQARNLRRCEKDGFAGEASRTHGFAPGVSLSHRMRCLACPAAHPLDTTQAAGWSRGMCLADQSRPFVVPRRNGGPCRSERAGGGAGEEPRPMRKGRFCWRSVPYARFCAWSFLVASDEVSRTPGRPPARHDTGRRLVERDVPGGSIETVRCSSQERWPLSFRAGGRRGRRGTSADATRTVLLEKRSVRTVLRLEFPCRIG